MTIFEIGIMARVTWNLHSLNNEGSLGNVTEPRTVVLASGERTDGISGEMLKHIHAYNVWLLQEDKSMFCAGCQKLHPQKADINPLIKKIDSPNEAMRKAISSCILCDLHGFLIQKPPVGRPSTVEFGWALGLPEKTHRVIHIHARHSMVGRSKEEMPKGESDEGSDDENKAQNGQTTAQMIYHRPTRSGVYALISVFQPWRIGLNEVDYSYVIDDNERKKRYSLSLNAYKASLMRTEGAMVSTRLPHVEAIEGVLAISEKNYPVPVLSPLNEDFTTQVEEMIRKEEGLTFRKFSNLVELSGLLDELRNEQIFKLNMP